MAHSLKKPEDPNHPDNWQKMSAEEAKEYATKLVAKQAGVEPELAAKTVAELKPADLAALVKHGRAGEIKACRDLLGLE